MALLEVSDREIHTTKMYFFQEIKEWKLLVAG